MQSVAATKKIVKKQLGKCAERENVRVPLRTYLPNPSFSPEKERGRDRRRKVFLRYSAYQFTLCTYLAAAIPAALRNQLQCRKLLVCPTSYKNKRETNWQVRKTFSSALKLFLGCLLGKGREASGALNSE